MRAYIGSFFIAICLMLCMSGRAYSALEESIVQLQTANGVLEGTLLVPEASRGMPVVLLVAGSGPTDRNGNQPGLHHNALLQLSGALAQYGIASLRYDKRGVGQSMGAAPREEDLRFEQYAADVRDWVKWLARDKRFGKITVIGHSEGSLLGMLAARQAKVANFISIAGPGRPADQLLQMQLASQPAEIQAMALPVLERLKQGKTVSPVNPALQALFRPSVQPYLISWFKYDPAKEIAKLKMPILIVQGTADIQVGEEDARLLGFANQDAAVVLIDGMNHILKQSVPDRAQNWNTYTQPELPVMPELTAVLARFIRQDGKLD
ncbi:alpha/beta hydrolase [Methylobacillus flagellatus]|uniref:Alpha/beta hydrolase fold protein n=1 Tax=Methylobacillus flagellatus (strain ATCC 51484 / DSM 6875 / VKM B-1610 / KT) TaxID=265072 RepID=Q1H504_METFK|nr:alpha/beta fold hydrolase [Methylobacillus flagellatus]ABE48433.1 alpha/beta hydrolase fold protein [Methylobacillus flagellatus KT]